MTTAEFDRKFDEGENISEFIDPDSISRPGLETQRVNVDFPAWVIKSLDMQSKVIGVSRQALIKLWISERLKEELRFTKTEISKR
ncbi:MAG: CopG family transcriptional regulator [Treponema sp. GWB1_62_6]|nr:MAG: CopG family transcriptional regulator [Treponema sp. GWC1_61_84]OHE69972.1 MAG: CopG family transcriptional regulator [Treponema sp. GWB1_62_6]OHE77122.1 MAG: CopG family transcriptional regulator [Treponema sp. RIFOXYC1_FULL_61_9]HCM25796.1 CopG family transcriptional regulator [Treponema sp.]